MLAAIGAESVDELFADLPEAVRLNRPVEIPDGLSETEVVDHLTRLAARNADADSELCFIGAGMYDHYSPAIVEAIQSRSEFLTPYTPYQPEVSQGGLQAMFEFQTAISELTGLPVANASLYEGPSSAASAAYLAIGATKGRRRFVASRGLHPHARDTLRTYSRGFGAEVVEVGLENGLTSADELAAAVDEDTAAVFVQNPNFLGGVEDLEALAAAAHDVGALCVASVDPITLGILKTPGRGRRGHRARRGTAARRAPGLRRPVVRVLRRRGGAPAPDAGADRRRDHATSTAGGASCSRSRPASSTSAARRPPTTSAPRRL